MRRADPGRSPAGWGLVEALVTLAVVGVAVSAAAPAWVGWRDRHRLLGAALRMAAVVDAARLRALRDGRSRGILFDDEPPAGWMMVVDGDGDGIRTADVRSGRDPVEAGPHAWEAIAPGVTLARDGVGPGGSRIPGDGVAISRDLLSISPSGSTTGGTLYLQGSDGAAAAVRWYGATGRPSVWARAPRTTGWERLR